MAVTNASNGSTISPQASQSGFSRQVRTFPWLLMLPTIVLLVALTIFPLIYSLYMSLNNYTLGGEREFVWFQNFSDLLSDRAFWRKIWFTLQITIFAVAIELVLGLLCALVLNKRLPGMGLLRMIVCRSSIPCRVRASPTSFSRLCSTHGGT